jgi:hypothetical protein
MKVLSDHMTLDPEPSLRAEHTHQWNEAEAQLKRQKRVLQGDFRQTEAAAGPDPRWSALKEWRPQ